MRAQLSIMALATVCCTTATQANIMVQDPPPPHIVGGWSVGQVDAEARKVAKFALPYLKRRGASIRSIDSVNTQVVAGTNYRIIMTLSDGSRWQVIVWKRLDQSYQFSSKNRVPAA